jgi:hypothetical protein
MSPRWNWDSSTLSLASECAPPPRYQGGGAYSPAGEGLGESHFRRLEKKLSTLPTLWDDIPHPIPMLLLLLYAVLRVKGDSREMDNF